MTDVKVGDLAVVHHWPADGSALCRISRITPKRAYIEWPPIVEARMVLPGSTRLGGFREKFFETEQKFQEIIITSRDWFMAAVNEMAVLNEDIESYRKSMQEAQQNMREAVMSTLKNGTK